MTTLNGFEPEQIAAEWATRVCDRMRDVGIPDDEIVETRAVIQAFTKTAAEQLAQDPHISVPYSAEVLTLDASQAHLVIELFLRGVNHSAKQLRLAGKSWEDRKRILEVLAWKLFNLAKLLVAFLHMPNDQLANVLSNPKDLQLMMRQSADVLVKQEITGNFGGPLPFDFPPGYR
jgi:hypothetical protein